MTGKTHMAVAACCTALELAATGFHVSAIHGDGGSSGLGANPSGQGTSYALDTLPVFPPNIFMLACLLAVGIVGGLFPDLDAPDTELTLLPGRMVSGVGRAARMVSGRRSPIAALITGIGWVIALPIATCSVRISRAGPQRARRGDIDPSWQLPGIAPASPAV